MHGPDVLPGEPAKGAEKPWKFIANSASLMAKHKKHRLSARISNGGNPNQSLLPYRFCNLAAGPSKYPRAGNPDSGIKVGKESADVD